MKLWGVTWSRILAGITFAIQGVVLFKVGLDMLNPDSDVAVLALIPITLATASGVLAARALASRVEFLRDEVRLHTLWRTRIIPSAALDGIARKRWFGWDVLAFKTADGKLVRLPLLTQPGDPDKLRDQETLPLRAISALSRERRINWSKGQISK